MGAQRLAAAGLGDEDSGRLPEHFQVWAQGILESQGQPPKAEAVANSVKSLLSEEVSSLWVRTTCTAR